MLIQRIMGRFGVVRRNEIMNVPEYYDFYVAVRIARKLLEKRRGEIDPRRAKVLAGYLNDIERQLVAMQEKIDSISAEML